MPSILEENRKILAALEKGDTRAIDFATNGGKLPEDYAQKFIQSIVDQSDFLQRVTTIDMISNEYKAYKISMDGDFLHKADELVALDPTKRSSPQTGFVKMTTQEMIGQADVSYSALEDNIERNSLIDTLMDVLIPRAVGISLVKQVLLGDTGSADTALNSVDGVLKLLRNDPNANTLMFNQVTGQVTDDLWADILETLPDAYRATETNLNYFVRQRVVDRWRRMIRQRLTLQGDQIIEKDNQAVMTYDGMPIRVVPFLPLTNALFGDPKNIYVGIQRAVTLETAKVITERRLQFVVTIRMAVAVLESRAMVLAENLNPSGSTT